MNDEWTDTFTVEWLRPKPGRREFKIRRERPLIVRLFALRFGVAPRADQRSITLTEEPASLEAALRSALGESSQALADTAADRGRFFNQRISRGFKADDNRRNGGWEGWGGR